MMTDEMLNFTSFMFAYLFRCLDHCEMVANNFKSALADFVCRLSHKFQMLSSC